MRVVSNNVRLNVVVREVLYTASSLSRKTLSVRTPVRCLEIVMRSCVADFCMFDRCGRHSHKVYWKKCLNVIQISFFYIMKHGFFCLYRIITETCTHVLLNHHFINTFSILECFNSYRVIFRSVMDIFQQRASTK